jgi:hypothetical protein
MNNAAKSNARVHDTMLPFLKYGETIELHPLYAAIERARELAKASGTEPAEVTWDDSWPALDLDHDHEAYWNELIQRNWETLSRWNAMARDPSRKGKALSIKARDGIEIIEEIDVLWNAVTK